MLYRCRLPEFLFILPIVFCCSSLFARFAPTTYGPADKRFQYTGRTDLSNPAQPRLWVSGTYVKARFRGNRCVVTINDGMMYGQHNYVTFVIDGGVPRRIRLDQKNNRFDLSEGLSKGKHILLICKATESGIGYIEFAGLDCRRLLAPPARPARRIEFIGNSITCGAGSDDSQTPCGKGSWQDQHDAYRSYGAVTARNLGAEWQLSSVSGIGLIHSCCNLKITMPKVFDKTVMSFDSIPWDFTRYTPDVVTVCLGQNDGIQDSTAFCGAYVEFIRKLRSYYPAASIICLTSPMADSVLTPVLKNYLNGVVNALHASGEKKVFSYYFSRRYHHGCGDHPNVDEHNQIAAELTACIKKELGW